MPLGAHTSTMSGLSNYDLHDFLSRYAQESFQGVYAYDTFQPVRREQLPISLVINACPTSVEMGHWVAVFINRNREGIFFDSYGLRPWGKFYVFLKNNSSERFYNTMILQKDKVSCGQHCIYFICQMTKGRTLGDVLTLYRTSDMSPDRMVNDYFNKRKKYIKYDRRVLFF